MLRGVSEEAFTRCAVGTSICNTLCTQVRARAPWPLRVCLAFLLELTELAKPVEMPRLCCNTQVRERCVGESEQTRGASYPQKGGAHLKAAPMMIQSGVKPAFPPWRSESASATCKDHQPREGAR